LALRAAAARRRHSSALRRNSSNISSRPSATGPEPLFPGRVSQTVSNPKHENG
jgi:hypothetical protein